MHLIVHPGWAKAGSTTLQKYMNDGEFRKVMYSRVLRGQEQHHYKLFEECRVGRASYVARSLAEEFELHGVSAILVSCELFSIDAVGSGEALRNLCAAAKEVSFKVSLVTFLRDPFAQLLSLYGEATKWGRVDRFSDFLKEHLYGLRVCDWLYPSVSYLDRALFVRCGEDLVSDFDRSMFGGRDARGVSGGGIRENIRFPDYVTEMLRVFNASVGDEGKVQELVALIDSNRNLFPKRDALSQAVEYKFAEELNNLIVADRILSLLFVSGAKFVDYDVANGRFSSGGNMAFIRSLL